MPAITNAKAIGRPPFILPFVSGAEIDLLITLDGVGAVCRCIICGSDAELPVGHDVIIIALSGLVEKLDAG